MNNILKPLFNGFFRKIGSILAIIFIIYILSLLAISNNIKLPDILKPIFTYVKADEFTGLYVDYWSYNNNLIPYDGSSDTFNIRFYDTQSGPSTKFFNTSVNVPNDSYYVYFKLYHDFKISQSENVDLEYNSSIIEGSYIDKSKQLFTITTFMEGGGWANCENVQSTSQNTLKFNSFHNIGYDTFKCPVTSPSTSISIFSVTYYVDEIYEYYTVGFNSNFQFLTSSGNKIITEQQATTQAINNLNDTQKETNDILKDDDTSEAETEASDFFNNFQNNNHGLTGIITAPLNAINNLSSATCTPLNLPLPFVNRTLDLPCMRPIYLEHFSNFMNIYDIVTLGIVSYWIMVRIFSLVKDFKNPEHDEIEVVDL